jgi:hypothetical protein
VAYQVLASLPDGSAASSQLLLQHAKHSMPSPVSLPADPIPHNHAWLTSIQRCFDPTSPCDGQLSIVSVCVPSASQHRCWDIPPWPMRVVFGMQVCRCATPTESPTLSAIADASVTSLLTHLHPHSKPAHASVSLLNVTTETADPVGTPGHLQHCCAAGPALPFTVHGTAKHAYVHAMHSSITILYQPHPNMSPPVYIRMDACRRCWSQPTARVWLDAAQPEPVPTCRSAAVTAHKEPTPLLLHTSRSHPSSPCGAEQRRAWLSSQLAAASRSTRWKVPSFRTLCSHRGSSCILP